MGGISYRCCLRQPKGSVGGCGAQLAKFWGLDSVHTVGLDWVVLWSDRAAKLQLRQASYVPEEGVELWLVAPLL